MNETVDQIVVIGDGWCALGLVGFLISQEKPVCWIAGTGSRLLSPLASLEEGRGVDVWKDLTHHYQVECGDVEIAPFIREFRNKAFRPPAWVKAPNREMKEQVLREELWAPEKRWIGAFDARFTEMTLSEIEDDLRERLLNPRHPLLTRIDPISVTAFQHDEDNQMTAVVLGSGEVVSCSRLYYADHWGKLPQIEGMPKPMTLLRKRDPMGALQALFTHEPTLQVSEVRESFFAALAKSAGEQVERHVFGHIFKGGKQSLWTLCLSTDELEDNHEIAKKLRKLKSTLDKIFSGSDLIPEGRIEFSKTVASEQVRFEEEATFAEGESPRSPVSLPQLKGITFLTDGYGPSWAMDQVSQALGLTISERRPNAEGEGMDLDSTPSLFQDESSMSEGRTARPEVINE